MALNSATQTQAILERKMLKMENSTVARTRMVYICVELEVHVHDPSICSRDLLRTLRECGTKGLLSVRLYQFFSERCVPRTWVVYLPNNNNAQSCY